MMNSQLIYLDYAATTPVDARVAEAMTGFMTAGGCFGNPASSHAAGRAAAAAVRQAREQVAGLIGARPEEIVWTSGATEADNLALKGAARARMDRGRHIVTMRTEHKAVLDTCRALEREGFEVTYLTPPADGILPPDQLREALRTDTILVSIMHVNNETGVAQDVAALAVIAHEAGAIFHVDAAQSVGKLPVDVAAMDIDLLSMSAHKLYGPKGMGALYVRREPRIPVEPQMHGGGHEGGMRSGTLAVHQIVGFGLACELAGRELAAESRRIEALRKRLWKGLAALDGVLLNGHPEARVPGILNVSFDYVSGEALLAALPSLAVSSGSACTSASREPSYVLRACGRDDRLAQSSLRFSMGRFTTEAEIDTAVEQVGEAFRQLRLFSPLWDEAAGVTEPDGGRSA
ncbi:MAG: IscS subfamily cysteine desulfurase [Gammaproteobacteria bacterium]|jgi:cysteine desulfurase